MNVPTSRLRPLDLTNRTPAVDVLVPDRQPPELAEPVVQTVEPGPQIFVGGSAKGEGDEAQRLAMSQGGELADDGVRFGQGTGGTKAVVTVGRLHSIVFGADGG